MTSAGSTIEYNQKNQSELFDLLETGRITPPVSDAPYQAALAASRRSNLARS